MSADQVADFLGKVARPFSIISTSSAAAWATVVVAYRVRDGMDAAALMTAIFAGLVGLYGFKAWEKRKEAEVNAQGSNQ